MKYFLFFLLLYCQNVFSQTSSISGEIINKEDNSKLASASIFINNSSTGTISGDNGKFTLNGITQQSFDLIITYSGFKTVSINITPENIGKFLTIKMESRKEILEGISILAPEKDGWKTWGKFFTESFIGQSDFAKKCIIENAKVIRFFNDKKNDKLTAYSNGNIIIHNKALGYELKCQLEHFEYDYKKKTIIYVGYTSFENMKTRSAKKRARWLKNRKEVFCGSVMHFMRSLYAGSVEEQGFDVYEKIRIPNTDSNFKKIYLPGNLPNVRIEDNIYKVVPGQIPDFKKIPDYVDLINQRKFSFNDAVGYDSTSKQKEFYFNNYIQVVYKKALAKQDYLVANHFPEFSKMGQVSDAYLISPDSLVIEKDGRYFDPINFMSSGYWGWCKMAEMLPIDYQPGD